MVEGGGVNDSIAELTKIIRQESAQAASWQAYAERLGKAMRGLLNRDYGLTCEHGTPGNDHCHECGRVVLRTDQEIDEAEERLLEELPHYAAATEALSSPRPSPSKLLEVARAAVRTVDAHLEVERGAEGLERNKPLTEEFMALSRRKVAEAKALHEALDSLSPAEREAIMGGEGAG